MKVPSMHQGVNPLTFDLYSSLNYFRKLVYITLKSRAKLAGGLKVWRRLRRVHCDFVPHLYVKLWNDGKRKQSGNTTSSYCFTVRTEFTSVRRRRQDGTV